MKKYVICIPTSTDFALSTAVLIYSLKKNLSIYSDCDVKVQYNDLNDDAKNLIKKGYEHVEKYTWSKCADQVIDVYNNF